MDMAHSIWYSCNEEMQLCNDSNNSNNSSTNEQNNNDNDSNNNNNNSHDNSNSNCTKNVKPTESTDTSVTAPPQVTFNHGKASELRQKRLQRQHEQQYSTESQAATPSPDISEATQTPAAAVAIAEPGLSVSTSGLEKSHNCINIVSTPRLTRRKRLQRQKPTDLDDADFAYAADLEEEDEDEAVEMSKHQQELPGSVPYHVVPHQAGATRVMAEKRLKHFPHQSTAFDGQPSSLPNCFTTAASAITTFQHHHHHHHQFHHHQQRERRLKHEESFDSSTTTTTNTTDTATSPASPSLRRHHFSMLNRDNSTHSESSSRYSSVDSLLEARKPDPEAILINLGFGPVGSEDILSRIPKRFLKPSQVRGIDTEAFIRRLQLANHLADHSVLGYRGLTGNPDIPPSRIVAKIMQRFEVNERKKSMGSIEHTI